MSHPTSEQETRRICEAYARRGEKGLHDRYSPLHPGALYLLQSRERTLLRMLRRSGYNDLSRLKVLDIGCGTGGELRRFVLYGADPANLIGVDLLQERVEQARYLNPNIRFLVQNAVELPFDSSTFDLVLLFTVLSSILERSVQQQVASEAWRVLRSGGAIMWYDFIWNPVNRDTRGVSLRQLRILFPEGEFHLRRHTLIPPIARRVAPISWTLCNLLEKVPSFRTHCLGLIRKGHTG